MNEDFLHYIWKFQRFSEFNLLTTDGQPVQVVHPGRHNTDAGPDFLDAKIRLGDTLWAGNVEIHISASDWLKHNHHLDKAYDNVILHVVYSADAEIYTTEKHKISTLSIRDKFDFQSYRYYKSWLKDPKFIACENLIQNVPSMVKMSMVQSSAISRLKHKAELCFDHLNETRGDIEGTFYRMLLRSFGAKVNALPFEQLARNAPIGLVKKIRTDATNLEAFFLGQAGLLDISVADDSYMKELWERYRFLQAKFDLTSMPASAWKLLRLRPQNFPAVRLAQVAALYARHDSLSDLITNASTTDELNKIFDVGLTHSYWKTHYVLGKESTSIAKHIGADTIVSLVINAVVPLMFALAAYNRDETWQARAIGLLEELPSESNSTVKRFKTFNFNIVNAFDSQGILHLKRYWCDPKKCLNCKVGIHLMKEYGNTGEIR